MSRIRIVKGTYTKITHGNHSMYSKGNINSYAGTVIKEIGEEEGVSYGEPEKWTPPIVESEYKLISAYAHEQLSLLAKELDELPFMIFIIKVFGEDIEASALSKLYRGLSNKSIVSPEILVTKYPVTGKKAGYSPREKKIIVWEYFIDLAVKDNDKRAELMAALVEEYGHYIDHLLRVDLATNGIVDTDYLDEGAKFAYTMFQFDIFKESELNYAIAQTPNFSGSLIIDFSKLHKEVQAYVDEQNWYDENPVEEIPGFGAGFEAGMHGGIEREALSSEMLFDSKEVLKIYYGNWLRDYSQVILETTVRLSPADLSIIKQKNLPHLNKLLKTNPYKLSHDGWIKILEILAAKEFVFDIAGGGKKFCHQYKDYVNQFRRQFGSLTKDILGLYRPEEHIDNPKDLKDFSSLSISYNYEFNKGSFKPVNLYAGEHPDSVAIDTAADNTGYVHLLKNCIHKHNIPQRPSSDDYITEQLMLAVQYGRNQTGFRHFGAALHVLEDFFSHSNFIEIALIKNGFSNVYPWVEGMQGKSYTTIPVVTGKFLLDDTLASILPKVADKMFPIGFTEYEQRKPGDRTFVDAFIVNTLEDLSTGQKSDGLETDPVYMGMKVSTWLKLYNNYLQLIDLKCAGLQMLGPLGNIIDRQLHTLADILSTFSNVGFNLFLASADETIKEEQTLHSNKNYGTDPTHTQLAKDALNHPLNPLAAELAKTCIRDVAQRVIACWNNSADPSGQELAKYVVNKYTIHPKNSRAAWADEIVLNWGKNNKNAIKLLESATIYEHAHEVTQRAISDKKIQEIINYFN